MTSEEKYRQFTEAYAKRYAEHGAGSSKPQPVRPQEQDSMSTAQAFKPRSRLKTVSGEDLMEMRFKRVDSIVNSLLTPGLCVLAGSPKVGKSWLVLQMCMQIARGEPFWGMQTKQSSVLYIALEDSHRRLRDRLLHITDECPSCLHFTTSCSSLGSELEEEITDFCVSDPFTKLVVIDTFQKIRSQGRELSYSNDYAEVSWLKEIADQLGICILLVHHTRKQGDSDYMNEISGTNGIAGSADTLMVLKREKRGCGKATLSCTGRDIEDRELELYFNRETCLWEVKSDNLADEEDKLPEDMEDLIAYMQRIKRFAGTNTAFCEGYNRFSKRDYSPRVLKYKMNRCRMMLLDRGVDYVSVKSTSGDKRLIQIVYCEQKPQPSDRR